MANCLAPRLALWQARAMLNHIFTPLKPLRSAWPSVSQSWALSDRAIVKYALAGRYGSEVQKQFLARRAKKKDANEGMFE